MDAEAMEDVHGQHGVDDANVDFGRSSLLRPRVVLTAGIAVLDVVVIAESACMLSLKTDPFFGTMERPTMAFIAFMILQMMYAAAAALLMLATCFKKVDWVRWHCRLFAVLAFNNIVYAISFVWSEQYLQAAVFGCVAVLSGGGYLCCWQFVTLFAERQLVPTTSPSFVRQKMLV